MEIKGWEEVPQKVWATLPLQIKATVTYSDLIRFVTLLKLPVLRNLNKKKMNGQQQPMQKKEWKEVLAELKIAKHNTEVTLELIKAQLKEAEAHARGQ